MLRKILFLIFIFLFCGSAWGAWNPIDYKAWQDSGDTTSFKLVIGGSLQNYQKADSSWALIENDWVAEGDTSWKVFKSFLKTRVWKNTGKSGVSVTWGGMTYGITQKLIAIGFTNIETGGKYIIDSTLNWNNWAIDGNSITWGAVSPGVKYKITKNGGRLGHRIIYSAAFIDSAVTLYNTRSDSLDIALANLMVFTLVNIDNPDSVGHIPKRKLKQFGRWVFELKEQQLGLDHEPGEDVDVPVIQEWYKKGGRYLCAEYVMMSDVKRLHLVDPTDSMWHSITHTITGTDSTFDAYISAHGLISTRHHENFGGKTMFYIGAYQLPTCGVSPTIDKHHAVFKGDIDGIPGGQDIDSALFKAYCSNAHTKQACGTGNTANIRVYPLIRDWNEGDGTGAVGDAGDVTWSHRFYSPADTTCPDGTPVDSCWYSWGADSSAYDHEATGQDSNDVRGTSQWYMWYITDAMQRWYSGSLANEGIVLHHVPMSDSCATFEFASSEAAIVQPEVVVYYHAVAAVKLLPIRK